MTEFTVYRTVRKVGGSGWTVCQPWKGTEQAKQRDAMFISSAEAATAEEAAKVACAYWAAIELVGRAALPPLGTYRAWVEAVER